MCLIKNIDRGIQYACTPLTGGTDDNLILVNYEDLLANPYTYETNVPTQLGIAQKYINAIARVPGTRGYLFKGRNNSINAVKEATNEGLNPVFTQRLNFLAFEENGQVEALIEQLAGGKVVAFYESNREFHVLGAKYGLRFQTGTSDTNDAETLGGFRISLQSVKEGEFGKRIGVWTGTSPNQVYDYAASKAIFLGLLNVA